MTDIAKLCGLRVISLIDDFDILTLKKIIPHCIVIEKEAQSFVVFVHISAVEKAGLRTLNENEKVSYDLVTEKGKTSAGNLAKA